MDTNGLSIPHDSIYHYKCKCQDDEDDGAHDGADDDDGADGGAGDDGEKLISLRMCYGQYLVDTVGKRQSA